MRGLGGAADMMMEADAEMEGFALAKSVASSAPMKRSRIVAKEKKGFADKKDADEAMPTGGGAGGDLKQAQVRKDFRSTVIWQPTINTDEEGKAVVKVKFPDSLTTWRATARSLTRDTSVGNITHDTRTKKDVIVRLQAPRFFVERDEVTLSANVHNYTDGELEIKVNMEAIPGKYYATVAGIPVIEENADKHNFIINHPDYRAGICQAVNSNDNPVIVSRNYRRLEYGQALPV